MPSDRRIRLGRVQPIGDKLGVTAFLLFCAAGLVSLYGQLLHPVSVFGAIRGGIYVAGGTWLVIYGLALIWRAAAWLNGTILTVRTPFGIRSADLSTATVRGDVQVGYKHAYSVSLIATDPQTNRAVNLRLGSGYVLELNIGDLIALADALEHGRADTPTNAEALRLAARLRRYCQFLPYSQIRYIWDDPPPLDQARQ